MSRERELARKDYMAGMSATEIARKYEKEPATVRQWVKRYGWKNTSASSVTKNVARDKKRDSVTKSQKTKRHGIENLIPFSQRTEQEQREIRSKGGKASQAVQRQKKTAQKVAEMILSGNLEAIAPDTVFRVLDALGLEQDDINVQAAILASQAKAALEGNNKAAEFIFAMAGEKPKEKLELSTPTNQTIQDIEDYLKSTSRR